MNISIWTFHPIQVEMSDWFYPTYHNHTSSAFYHSFKVGRADTGFRLVLTEFQIENSGSAEDAGDSMTTSNSMQVNSKYTQGCWT